jgi:hypothetical protein
MKEVKIMKLMTTLCLLGLLQCGILASIQAADAPATTTPAPTTAAPAAPAAPAAAVDTKALRDELMAIDKQLRPVSQKAMADPQVKAALAAVKAAQEKVRDEAEAAMIRLDPTTMPLLEKRKRIVEQLTAARPPAMTKPATDKQQ